MKKYFLLLILFSIFTNAQNTDKMITKLVNANLVSNLEKIPMDKENLYGFNNRKEFQSCISGKPIRVVTLDENNNLVKQNIWRVPIILNGNNKILFTVNIINNHFKIVDFGGVALAKELQFYQTNDKLVLLRLYQNYLDFVSSVTNEENFENLKFIPLEASKIFIEKASNKTNKKWFTIDEIKALIK
jgi:hypothetical protein